MDLDDVADELYEVPPDEFVAARTARQDEAKAAGDKALAKEIGALPKPSTAAWACNLLVRARREEIEGLVELGDLLRDAQTNLAGDELKALNRQRSQLLGALSRQAVALGRERGHSVSSAVTAQVEETLRAGMADPEAGQALLTGRLTTAMSYSGMGTTASRANLRLVHPPKPPKERTPPATKDSAVDRRRQEAEERRRRKLADARRAADEAATVAVEAESAAEDARRTADELDRRRAELQDRVDELTEELARAEEEAAVAARELERAQRRRRTAEREAADAVAARESAEARVADLAE